MRDLPRQKLLDVVRQYGPSIAEDRRRLEALLAYLCGDEYRLEINLLMGALHEGIAKDLAGALRELGFAVTEAADLDKLRLDEAVRTFDMIAVLALIGLFLFLINTSSLPKTLLVTAALLVYDFILRAIFLHLEAKRICAASPKWRYREARRRVRNRVRRATTV